MHTTCQCHPCWPFEGAQSELLPRLCWAGSSGQGIGRQSQDPDLYFYIRFFVRRLWQFSVLALNKLHGGEKPPCILASLSFTGLQ